MELGKINGTEYYSHKINVLIGKNDSKGPLCVPETLNFAHFLLGSASKNGFFEPLDDILLDYKTYCICF